MKVIPLKDSSVRDASNSHGDRAQMHNVNEKEGNGGLITEQEIDKYSAC